MFSMRALECLVAIVEQGSLTKAAAVLHISQPALSHQIAAIERELGTPVIERLPRGIRPIAAGLAAVAEARIALAAAGRAVIAGRRVAQGPGVWQVSVRHARSLDPPPGLRAAIRRQHVVARRRSGRRDGIDEIHRDNGLADHREAPATSTDRGAGNIDIRDFDECHEFFETSGPCPGHK